MTGQPPEAQQEQGLEQEQQCQKDENSNQNQVANENILNQPPINIENLD